MADKELAATIRFTIPAFRKTKHGGIILNLLVPDCDAVKAFALGMYEDTIFEADIFAVKPETIGKSCE